MKIIYILVITLCLVWTIKEITIMFQGTKVYEGLRLKAYKDTMGHLTIGYGHNLDVNPDKTAIAMNLPLEALKARTATITKDQADTLFQLDYAVAKRGVEKLVPNIGDMPKEVQDILVDLVFNMGVGGLGEFHNTLTFFRTMNWKGAANGLEASKWYHQVGNRSKDIVDTLRNL